MATHEYDIVLYGATGFTGKFVAQYLAEHPQAPRIALAGRNASKVRAVRDGLVNVTKERIESIGLVEASAGDEASLQRLAALAKVVINTVGPFRQLGGFDVAKAAAEAGTGYVDLTGESDVYADEVKGIHAIAQKTNAVIIPSSGFDCLPFDLSTYFAVQEVKKVLGPDAEIDHVLLGYDVKGSVSGGTFASALSMAKHPYALSYSHPYWFSPVQGVMKTQPYKTRFLPQFNKSGSYTMFAPHNTRVVNRSWGLQEEAHLPTHYGPEFRYLEAEVSWSSLGAFLVSCKFQLATWMFNNMPFIGRMAQTVLPQGSGSSLEEQLKGHAKLRTIAYGRDGKTKGLSVFSVQGDPGYYKTGAFLSESALAIALDKDRLTPMAHRGGVLTWATAGPEVVMERLVKYGGVTFAVADITNEANPSKVLA